MITVVDGYGLFRARGSLRWRCWRPDRTFSDRTGRMRDPGDERPRLERADVIVGPASPAWLQRVALKARATAAESVKKHRRKSSNRRGVRLSAARSCAAACKVHLLPA